MRRALREALARPGEQADFVLTPISVATERSHHLVVSKATAPLESRARAAAKRWRLTRRQGEVMMWLLRGASNARIGAELGISDRTVETHVAAIFERANVASRAALVAEVSGTAV